MSQETEIKPIDMNNLTITEQLLFILETLRDKENLTILEAKKNYAIMGAVIADLFNLKKADLENNKMVIIDNTKTEFEYINDLIGKLGSLEKNKLLIDVIFGYQYKGKDIENKLVDELINKKLLVEKRNFLPLIIPKKIEVSEKAFIKDIKEEVVNALSNDLKPKKEFIYVLAILDAIDLLPYFCDSDIEVKEKEIRLNELIGEEHLAKLVHNSIKNLPEPESLAMYEEYPVYTEGGLL